MCFPALSACGMMLRKSKDDLNTNKHVINKLATSREIASTVHR